MTDPRQKNAAESMLDFVETMTPILDAVTGYRAQCEERGYSPTAAEHMAMDLHSHIVAKVFSDAGATP